jgi:hypothetical protein
MFVSYTAIKLSFKSISGETILFCAVIEPLKADGRAKLFASICEAKTN